MDAKARGGRRRRARSSWSGWMLQSESSWSGWYCLGRWCWCWCCCWLQTRLLRYTQASTCQRPSFLFGWGTFKDERVSVGVYSGVSTCMRLDSPSVLQPHLQGFHFESNGRACFLTGFEGWIAGLHITTGCMLAMAYRVQDEAGPPRHTGPPAPAARALWSSVCA
jgi:hypothetical protein